MRASDLQKVLELVHDSVAEAFDHFASRFADAADDLGDEFEPLRDFGKTWSKLEGKGRKLFIEQLLKSAGLVAASAAATRIGFKLAGKKQKQIRKGLLALADLIQPVAKKAKKKGKKKLMKAAKKKLKAVA